MTPSPDLTTLIAQLAAGEIDLADFDRLRAQLSPHAATAQGSTEASEHSVVNTGGTRDIVTGQQINAQTVINAEPGATIVIGDVPVAMTAVQRDSALGRYLLSLIGQHRYLQLQGIRSCGKLVNIELDRIFISLRASGATALGDEQRWLVEQAAQAPGELARRAPGDADAGQLSVNQALAQHRRLVVLGDPGSGKTTLLRYLALLYARDLADHSQSVTEKTGLAESGLLPIFMPLRQIGRYLATHHAQDDGTQGHAVLLRYLVRVLRDERITVPEDFFDSWLQDGRAVVLLDGLDEVADPALRQRVAQLVDGFTRAYPGCRFVVTSRIVGYTDGSRLAEGYATTTVRDFTLADVAAFIGQWHQLLAVAQHGDSPAAQAWAASQTRQLLEAMHHNQRVRELAINPLMLTVIALVHRDRVKLPDRRAELYEEAVDVLLGKWDDARGVPDAPVIDGQVMDIGDRRLVLQELAWAMHCQGIKEIEAEPLRAILAQQLGEQVPEPRALKTAVKRFLSTIQERSGLLIARSEGSSFAFSHLTFQEYLAALALAGRDDYIEQALLRSPDVWWREVIQLTAGHLSGVAKAKATRLIRALADVPEPADAAEPYHHLVLAADCVRDAGAGRLIGDLAADLRSRLERELGLGAPASSTGRRSSGQADKAALRRRIAAADALGRIGGHAFWHPPHGEPDWIAIPAGPFTMGDGDAQHSVTLPAFAIAKVPVTQAQYLLFTQASGHPPPSNWSADRPPRGFENHPVHTVTWHDAIAYCAWLGGVIGKPVALPSEAEWEKAARGDADARVWPWGDKFEATRCNTGELGLGQTSPVGIFSAGASPSGCLDMAGNVWEWTRSLWGTDFSKPQFGYPYLPDDPLREDLGAGDEMLRLVRGGSWFYPRVDARCACRIRLRPDDRGVNLGFRVVLRSSPV